MTRVWTRTVTITGDRIDDEFGDQGDHVIEAVLRVARARMLEDLSLLWQGPDWKVEVSS